jgi:hypothetical protein
LDDNEILSVPMRPKGTLEPEKLMYSYNFDSMHMGDCSAAVLAAADAFPNLQQQPSNDHRPMAFAGSKRRNL